LELWHSFKEWGSWRSSKREEGSRNSEENDILEQTSLVVWASLLASLSSVVDTLRRNK
jgi:hypothetical protein